MPSQPGCQTTLSPPHVREYAQTKARDEHGLIQVNGVSLSTDHYLKFCGLIMHKVTDMGG